MASKAMALHMRHRGHRPVASVPMQPHAIVVGAGPAGSAAAIHLARAGAQVTVIDKARFPRDKCCGDGLTTGALRQLAQLGFDPASVSSFSSIDSAWIRSPTGYTQRYPFPTGRGLYAAVAPRAELDAALLDMARSAGAEVHEGHGLGSVEQTDGVVHVAVDGLGQLAADYVIGADGMWSPLRRQLGLTADGYRGEAHAFRQYFSGVTGTSASQLWVWFEPDLLPGYAWSFPLPGGRANVGFGIIRGSQVSVHDMKRLWPDLFERAHIREALGPDAVAEDRHLAWPLPARIDSIALGTGRALFVGDAAAATDPLTGEGIGQAMLTGRLAAEAILAAGPAGPDGVQSAYRRSVRAALVSDHRTAVAVQRILRHRRGARGSLRMAGSTDWTRRSFARWMFEDEPRAVLVTPRRWHRQFFDRDGANFPVRP